MAKINGEKLINIFEELIDRSYTPPKKGYGDDPRWRDGWNDALNYAITTISFMNGRKSSSNNQDDDYIQVYINQAELWVSVLCMGRTHRFDIVNIQGKELTLISREIILFTPFSVNDANTYSNSNVKDFLGNEFLSMFIPDFRDLIIGEGFYLPSEEEILAFYSNSMGRIKSFRGKAFSYWLRDMNPATKCYVRCVSDEGSIQNGHAITTSRGIAPVCKIDISNFTIENIHGCFLRRRTQNDRMA